MTRERFNFGHHFIVGLSGISLSAEEAEQLSLLQPTGVILFAKNIGTNAENWLDCLRCFLIDITEAVNRDDLLICVDHEGGRVHRFPEPVTRFPPARFWREKSAAVGEAMGKELRALGFNTNFAPVLDVHSEAHNQVIGLRAFSTIPKEVTPFAASFAQAMEQQGVLSCIKHFPGHGATVADSHVELPLLNVDEELIYERELCPFIDYFLKEPPLLMTAHVRYPALDPLNPATMSNKILTTILRDRLGYKGVVVSDDLEMSALSEFNPSEKAVLALNAGVDLLLEAYPRSGSPINIALEMAKGIEIALKAGNVTEELLEQSAERIQALKDYSQKLLRNTRLKDYPASFIGAALHQELARSL